MIKKCMFPVAGYGTRFLPATKSMPKEMLPIVNKPLVQYGVEEAIDAGLSQISLVTGRGKRAIADHFDISYELEHEISNTGKEKSLSGVRHLIDQCTFSYTRQIEMKGLGHAILTGRSLIGDEAFAVVLADDLSYVKDPKSRGLGFALSSVPSLVMLVGVLVEALRMLSLGWQCVLRALLK